MSIGNCVAGVLLFTIIVCSDAKSIQDFLYNFRLHNNKPIKEHCGKSAYRDDSRTFKSFHKRIVGGEISQNHEWPWLVTMQLRKNRSSNNFEHLCGGTLIHPQWILTAAHCFEPIWAEFLTSDPDAWLMRIGEHNMFIDQGTHIDVKPEKIFFHPDRNPPRTINKDIALVKLEYPVKLNDRVNVACLPRDDEYVPPGTYCVTAGWGHTTEDGNMSEIVQHVEIPVLSNEECNFLYGRISSKVNIHISDDMMCAGLDVGGKDACQFDSGGPMVCYDADDDQWLLTGIVMTGYGCARAGFPGIYTRVSDFIPWIEEVIGQN